MTPEKSTGRFPTPEDVARILKIPKARVRQLERIDREISKMVDFATEEKVDTSGQVARRKSYKKAS